MALIRLYNTLTGKKEQFKPILEGKVGIYSCGPTVYNRVHIGNLRAAIFPDILRRMFEFNDYEVIHVRNITDVDDKTIRKSQEEKISLSELTEKYERIYFKDLSSLNVLPTTASPHATDHIPEMIKMIEVLMAKGFAYKAADGIYFSISKAKEYGKLVHLKVDISSLKERIANDEYDKENPQDFALWKFWNEADGEVAWDASFGKGRPGWHIECSAMSEKYLGDTFDIHTGGIDLAFPHHTNEIAQSESAHGVPFVHYWLHNAFVNVSGEKMAKSAGNFTTLETVIDHHILPLAFRYWLLTAHYRTQVNFTFEALEGSQKALDRLVEHLKNISDEKATPDDSYVNRFTAHINDDLDTPQAVALIWELIKDMTVSDGVKKATILFFDTVLGLNLEQSLKDVTVDIPEEVQHLVSEREQARNDKDWGKSDELRGRINAFGFDIKDTDTGPKLSKKI